MSFYVKKLLRILLEGQAYLYADLNRMRVEAKGGTVTEEMFDAWRKEWAEETQKQVEEGPQDVEA